MRLLIVTQKVNRNDPILGFFHLWLIEFSKHFEKMTVICLEEGEHQLPENVSVYSLGKGKGFSKVKIIFNFLSSTIVRRSDYDRVLVHMNPIYIVLGGLIWKMMRKEIFLWYTHKSVDLKLKIAEKFVKKVFTASKESFRLASNKVVVTNHAIPVDLFKPDYKRNDIPKLLSVGRIAESKKCEIILRALEKIRSPFKLCFLGGPIFPEDYEYQESLKRYVVDKGLKDKVVFVGSVSPSEALKYFQSSDILLHPSETGSLDKVVLESMACGIPVISSNDSAVPILSKIDSNLVFKKGDHEELAKKIEYFYKMRDDLHYFREKLRQEVVKNHNLVDVIKKVSSEIYE